MIPKHDLQVLYQGRLLHVLLDLPHAFPSELLMVGRNLVPEAAQDLPTQLLDDVLQPTVVFVIQHVDHPVPSFAPRGSGRVTRPVPCA